MVKKYIPSIKFVAKCATPKVIKKKRERGLYAIKYSLKKLFANREIALLAQKIFHNQKRHENHRKIKRKVFVFCSFYQQPVIVNNMNSSATAVSFFFLHQKKKISFGEFMMKIKNLPLLTNKQAGIDIPVKSEQTWPAKHEVRYMNDRITTHDPFEIRLTLWIPKPNSLGQVLYYYTP